MIIDCHTHLNNYHEHAAPGLAHSVARLRAAMAEAGIDYALVLTSYLVNDDRPSIRQVIEAIGDAPDLGVVAGISYLNYKERDLRELADDLRAGRVKGLKLYPGYEPFYPHDKRLKVVYDLAEEFDVPVMIHSGDTFSPKGKLKYAHPLEIDEVAVDHPAVKFVICHLGNPWLTDAMEVVYKNANVFADISGLILGEFTQAFEDYMGDEIEDVVTYAGEPEKFLFGTDWPICSMKSYLEFVGRLEISARDRRLLLYENSRRLFKLPLPPQPEEPDARPAPTS
ncbi:MAG TPA: amidohydrolase family protein [Gemmatimonadales bacterium]|nr:amidohydrolase family protein [Gemmatimonadales bacterium]